MSYSGPMWHCDPSPQLWLAEFSSITVTHPFHLHSVRTSRRRHMRRAPASQVSRLEGSPSQRALGKRGSKSRQGPNPVGRLVASHPRFSSVGVIGRAVADSCTARANVFHHSVSAPTRQLCLTRSRLGATTIAIARRDTEAVFARDVCAPCFSHARNNSSLTQRRCR